MRDKVGPKATLVYGSLSYTGLSRQLLWAHGTNAHSHYHTKEFYYGTGQRSSALTTHGHSLKRIARTLLIFKRGGVMQARERVPAHSQRGRAGGGSVTDGRGT